MLPQDLNDVLDPIAENLIRSYPDMLPTGHQQAAARALVQGVQGGVGRERTRQWRDVRAGVAGVLNFAMKPNRENLEQRLSLLTWPSGPAIRDRFRTLISTPVS